MRRVFDIPFALGCMTYVCRRFALQFDRTEQLAQELDTRVIERTRALTEETEARKSMMLNIFHDLRSPAVCREQRAGYPGRGSRRPAGPAAGPAAAGGFCPQSDGRPFSAAKLEQKQVLLRGRWPNEAAAAVCAACQSEAAQKGVTLRADDGLLPARLGR